MNDALSRLAAGGLNEPLMQGLKDHFLTAEAANLQSNIGHFIMWFGTAEMFLTRLLAHLVGMHDMEKFDLLCKGMDARIKCERFKKAAKQAGGLGKSFLMSFRILKKINPSSQSHLSQLASSTRRNDLFLYGQKWSIQPHRFQKRWNRNINSRPLRRRVLVKRLRQKHTSGNG